MKVIVLIPTRGVVASELLGALVNNCEDHQLILRTVNRLPVDAARNRLAELAIAAADDVSLFPAGSDPYVFWIDSDAFFLKGTLSLMIHTLETNPLIDVLAALFGPRAADRGAAAFRTAGDRESHLHPDVNFTRGDLIDVDLVGLHFLLHRVSLLRRLGSDPFGTPDAPNPDDAAFCGLIRHGGGRITVATGIPVFHVDVRNGAAYSPGIAACVIDGDRINTSTLASELPAEMRSYGERVDRAGQAINNAKST
jgi:hypothetical protein